MKRAKKMSKDLVLLLSSPFNIGLKISLCSRTSPGFKNICWHVKRRVLLRMPATFNIGNQMDFSFFFWPLNHCQNSFWKSLLAKVNLMIWKPTSGTKSDTLLSLHGWVLCCKTSIRSIPHCIILSFTFILFWDHCVVCYHIKAHSVVGSTITWHPVEWNKVMRCNESEYFSDWKLLDMKDKRWMLELQESRNVILTFRLLC